MKKTGTKKPGLLTTGVNLRRYWIVNLEATQEADGTWTWEAIRLNPEDRGKSQITARLVEYKYPLEKITNILQSYLSTPEDLSVIWEYEALQAWKTEASKIAEQVVGIIDDYEKGLQQEEPTL